MKKFLAVFGLGAAVVILSGCGIKNVPVQNQTSSVNVNTSESQKEATSQEEKLPVPSGKVDDIVNAMTDETNKEKANLSDEETAASEAANDTDDLNNLSNSYDENEL